MKQKIIKLFIIIITFVVCTKINAQIPPHPSLLEKIKNGKIKIPFTLSNVSLLKSQKIDQPWAEISNKTLNKQNEFSRLYGPEVIPKGSWKALAILVQFTDKPSQENGSYFDNLIFGQNMGTLHDYYEKVSYGNLDIVTINLPSNIGWLTAPQEYSYYVNGQNGKGSYPQNAQKLVEDIVNLVDPQIDFSQYDNDGDSYVDALFIVHTGPGAEYTGNDNDIWSHAWATKTAQFLDGVNVYRYSIEPEYWEQPGDMTCGVFAHEMGHSVFGLPDLYDMDYSSKGLGNWSLMASGNWNGINGSSPSFPDAWSLSQMGYLIPTVITSNILGQSISNIENTPEAYLLQNSLCGTEYFLVENRQQTSYDSFLPGNGLCIYHIDNSVSNNNNEWYPGHTSSGHYRVALEQADGSWGLEQNNNGSESDAYPGLTDNKNFCNASIPDSRTYSFNPTGIEVSNISSSSLIMNADFYVDTQIQLPQFAEQELIDLSGVNQSSAAWGDYDNDGYLDILLTGNSTSRKHAPVSKLYRNNGNNTFTEQSISLTGVDNSSVAWGDYDNDGFLDILLTGYIYDSEWRAIAVTKLYHNNGDNTFTEEAINLPGLSYGSVAWGDYDNDGDLDILLIGNDVYPINRSSKIYRNNGDKTFAEQKSISLTGISEGSAAWGDYDNDGFLDIILAGIGSTSLVSKIYHNNGDNTFTEQTSISLTEVWQSSVTWGDYDNDGYLDIILTGSSSNTGGSPITKIYHNNGDNTFSEQTSLNLPGFRISSTAWGDYNNDGYLDILLTGFPESGLKVSRIYHNNGDNTFTESSRILTDVSYGSAVWGDYNNDRNLDILLTGRSSFGLISKIYCNNNSVTNWPPSKPTNLNAEINGNDVTLNWDKGNDNKTPQNGLTYNLIIGTSSGACDILSPMSDLSNGKRRVISMGNAGHCNSKTIKGLPYGKYYWSVQTIDNSFVGSKFAETQSFTIQAPQTIIITFPKGGEVWEVDSNPIITYSSFGNSGKINIDYSTDGGTTWDTIAANTVDDGDYTDWIVPKTPSANCKIRVSDVDGDPSVISDGLFLITQSQFSEQTSISLIDVLGGSASWGDYDNDGDLDILSIGLSKMGYALSSIIYSNNGNNTFTEQTSIELTPAWESSAAWGDYDNDGDLDILITGEADPEGFISKIYRNEGNNNFSKTSISLTGLYWGSVAWGDYDNDGDLDILLTGAYVSIIYQNNGNDTFTEQTSISLIGVSNSSVAWGDYDKDGDLDILLTGDINSGGVTKIYRNDGDNSFTDQTSISLIGVRNSSVAWGDYDNDGYLDILLTGDIEWKTPVSKIYHNNRDNTFTEQPSISLTGVCSSSVAWGDYDNDGYLDILLTGLSSGGIPVSKIYHNNRDNTFEEQTSENFIGVTKSSVAWGDYDNDGDLDILLTGSASDTLTLGIAISKIYRNNSKTPNTPPQKPSNLKTEVNGSDVTFNWDKSTDNETQQNGLKYNLSIGTHSDSADILSPMSDLITGYRRVINLGNTNHDTSWTIKNLPDGKYYWSVQTIDNCFTGSEFAERQSFIVSTNNKNIDYKITLPNCDSLQTPIVIEEGNFSEGESMKIPEYNIPNQYASFQPYYNSLEGAELFFPIGSLNENIKIEFIINGICENGLIDNPDTEEIVEVLYLSFKIIGDSSGVHNPLEYYNFSDDKEAYLKIALINIDSLMELLNYNIDSLYPFFSDNRLEPNFEGIRKEIDENYYTIYFKHLSEIKLGVISSPTSIKNKTNSIPTEYKLEQNYPNPFNPSTTIKYSIPSSVKGETSKVKLIVYDVLGKEIETLVNETKSPGYYEVTFDASNLSSGIYFYRIQCSDFTETKKMFFIK